MRLILATVLLLVTMMTGVAPTAGDAQEPVRIGYGRLITNDYYGDGQDRGHTADVQASWIWGPAWTGRAPTRGGALIELRFGGGILTPRYLVGPEPGDRPYAGYLGLGLHTHATHGGWDWSAGVDLIATGPQTGLGGLQTVLHETFYGVPPSQAVLDNQIEDAIHPTVTVELGRDVALGERAVLRPFVEGRAGIETMVRLGADLTIGRVGRGELLVRDVTTGQRYRAVRQAGDGVSLVLGADVARVSGSAFLPEARGYDLTDTRPRVRAGVHWQGARGDAFYGVTWLGDEFEGQPEDQVVGSLRLNLKF